MYLYLDKMLKELKEAEKRQKQLEKKEKKVCLFNYLQVYLFNKFYNFIQIIKIKMYFVVHFFKKYIHEYNSIFLLFQNNF